MKDLYDEKLKSESKIFEALLEYAGACHVNNIINDLEEANDEEIPYPEELSIKIRKMLRHHKRKETVKKFFTSAKKTFPKVAVFFFVVFIGFTLAITTVSAFRARVFNLIIEIKKDYTDIKLKENNEPNASSSTSLVPSNWENEYYLSYVPHGFKISKIESQEVTKIIQYTNDKGDFIIFSQSSSENTDMMVDTENAVTQKIDINGYEGILIQKNGLNTIVWRKDNNLFSLMSKIDKNELIKSANSIKLKK
ncbi:DUF4367 domain-containing protein [Thermoanaerobacterium saccharolyticum]|uniref:DUF4367 domain-containing protein n=1 Tax=Thermoanaerobacterium saccharolyticum TaxID=28896 RepID=UPI0005F022FF